MRRLLLLLTAVVCVMFVAGAAKADVTSLPATQLCAPMSTALDVNDSGTAAGYTGSWPNVQAVTCSGGDVLTYLNVPSDATGSIASAINGNGQVAGEIILAGGQEAVVWDSNGEITRLGFLPGGNFSSAYDINDDGDVVGVVGAGGLRGFVWDGDGAIEELPMPPGMTSTFAEAINNGGAIVGSASGPSRPVIAVLWDGGAPVALEPLVAGASAAAIDINDAGEIVGSSATVVGAMLPRHPALWQSDGDLVDLDPSPARSGWTSAINDDGQVAGYREIAPNQLQAFLWDAGTITSLEPLSEDSQSVTAGINGAGTVVGISLLAGGAGRAVSWSQVLDTTPPEITVSVSPSLLWPANHKYVTAKATVTATDDSGTSPTIALASVTSSEPDNALGDGDTASDIVIEPASAHEYPDTFQLRAERSGTGTGRVYTISYTATDSSGNSATASATVTVPLWRM